MTDHLAMLMALCGAGGPAGGVGLLLALLMAGAVGGVAHCVPMCGPFVLAQVSSGLARIPAARLCERQRLTSGVLLPYHLGRLCTYAILGMIAASSGGALAVFLAPGWLPAGFLLLGAMFFFAQAVQRLAPRWRPFTGRRSPAFRGAFLARVAARVDRSRPGGGFLLGVVLGFLPCGFLYAALAVAAATGVSVRGALAMIAFGLGTAASLVVLGVAGQAGGRAWNRALAAVGPALLLVNSAVLMGLAWQRLAFS